MSIIYKDPKDIKHSVDISEKDGKLYMLFYCDGGKLGTHEILYEIEIGIDELLKILKNAKQ